MSRRIGANNEVDTEDDITAQTVSGKRGLHVYVLGGTGITYDYLARTEPAADTDTFTYKTGGSGGTTVAVITVVYESAAKEEILTITRTT